MGMHGLSEMSEMEQIEAQILHLLKDLSRIVPLHIEKWKDVLKPLMGKVKGVAHLTEQLQAVTLVKLDSLPHFLETQERLRVCVINCIEEDLKHVRELIDKISRINTQFRDKLDKLENTSLLLDWETIDSALLQGSPTIPPLAMFLQDALEFYTFFDQIYQNMKNGTKSMELSNRDCMQKWENSFIVDLDNNVGVNRLLAITQYVDNEVVLT